MSNHRGATEEERKMVTKRRMGDGDLPININSDDLVVDKYLADVHGLVPQRHGARFNDEMYAHHASLAKGEITREKLLEGISDFSLQTLKNLKAIE